MLINNSHNDIAEEAIHLGNNATVFQADFFLQRKEQHLTLKQKCCHSGYVGYKKSDSQGYYVAIREKTKHLDKMERCTSVPFHEDMEEKILQFNS